jgi:hypothetical protein
MHADNLVCQRQLQQLSYCKDAYILLMFNSTACVVMLAMFGRALTNTVVTSLASYITLPGSGVIGACMPIAYRQPAMLYAAANVSLANLLMSSSLTEKCTVAAALAVAPCRLPAQQLCCKVAAAGLWLRWCHFSSSLPGVVHQQLGEMQL